MKLPDGPGTPPILQTIEAIAHPLERLEKCAQRYGDPFTSRVLGFPPIVTFSSPQAIQEIFTADPSLFDSGAGNRNIQFLLGDNSLILLDGDRHQRQRRLLTPPFHGERMRTYGKLICNIAEQVISQWTIGNPFLVRVSMQEISLRVILRVVFGIDEGERFQQLRQLLSSLLDSIGSPLGSSLIFMRLLRKDLGSWSPWGRFLRQKQQIDELLYAEIRQRRDEPNRSGEDILSLMMAARDEQGCSNVNQLPNIQLDWHYPPVLLQLASRSQAYLPPAFHSLCCYRRVLPFGSTIGRTVSTRIFAQGRGDLRTLLVC